MNIIHINFVLIVILILITNSYFNDKKKIREGAWWSRKTKGGWWQGVSKICYPKHKNYCNSSTNCANANCGLNGYRMWSDMWDYGGWGRKTFACKCKTNFCHAGYKMKSRDTKSNRYSSTVCNKCPWGQWSSYGNKRKSCSTWRSCPKGKKRANGSYTKNATCSNCPARQYQPHNNHKGGCWWFPSSKKGYYRSGQSKKNGGTQTICPAGWKCVGAKHGQPTKVQMCSKGEYQNRKGKTFCWNCPTGKYQPAKGKSSCANWPKTDAGDYRKDASRTKSGTNTECPVGHKCPGGKAGKAAPKIACPAGTYQSSKGKSSCSNCPTGKYQPKKGKSSCAIWPKTNGGYYRIGQSRTKSGTNTKCPVGHKCPGGKAGKAAPKIACPAGENQSSKGKTYCSQCPTGTYSGAGSSNCANWPKTNGGYYRIGQSKTKPGRKTKCPVGHRCPYKGSRQAAPKIACPAGTYQRSKGKSSCSNCLAGTYQNARGKDKCEPCPTGKWSRRKKKQCTDWKSCNMGQRKNSGTRTRDAICIDCPKGFYQPKKSNKGFHSMTCLPIQSGNVGKRGVKYNINKNGVYDKASTGEVPCPLGYSCNNNKMKKCPSGFYQDEKGKTTCKTIQPGKYGKGVVADFFSNNKIEPFKSIVDCEGGYYCKGGSIGKQVCPIGKYCPKGSNDAKDCPTGSYTNVEGSSECSSALDKYSVIYNSNSLKCPSGFIPNKLKNDCVIEADWTNDPANKTYPLKEVVCKKGFENSDKVKITEYKHNDDIEVSCNPGYFGGGKFKCNYGTISGLNYSPKNKSKSCKPCPEGSFQNEKGKYKCVKCMEGTFQDEKGKEKCKLCDINKYQDGKGETSCKVCNEGEYQDIIGAKSCKKFCNDDSTYTQISGPKYDGKIPYGLYEKEKKNDINTYHSCDTSGKFEKLSNNDKLKGNSYYCMGSSYTCGETKKHLKPEVEYDGTEKGFSDSCCSEFPQNKPFQYLNSASCKLTGKMGLEDGYNILEKKGYIEWLKGDGDNSPNHKEDYSSSDNQIKWNKYVKK